MKPMEWISANSDIFIYGAMALFLYGLNYILSNFEHSGWYISIMITAGLISGCIIQQARNRERINDLERCCASIQSKCDKLTSTIAAMQKEQYEMDDLFIKEIKKLKK